MLLVDDDSTMLFVYRRCFRGLEGVTVTEASSGEQAIELLRERSFDCILTDHRMGAKSGIDVLEFALHARPDAVRILATGYIDPRLAADAEARASVHEVIEKPMSMKELVDVFRTVVVDRHLARLIAARADAKALIASEDLASFLQGAPDGSHVAVTLHGMTFDRAMDVARRAAADRGERLVAVGPTSRVGSDAFAASLEAAVERWPEIEREYPAQGVLVVVDATSSIEGTGAESHARAEHKILPRDPRRRMTTVCVYTEEAERALRPHETLDAVHAHVAAPGMLRGG